MKNITKVISIVVISTLIIGCSSSDEMTKDNLTQIIRSGSKSIQVEAQSDNYIIRQGDQIKLSVWSYPEFNTDGPVKETGAITVPLVGEIVAAGLTKEQFSDQMQKKLAEFIQGEVKLTVSVQSTVAQKVAVLGAVSKQENYPVTSDISLLEILSTAGGTTAESDLRHVKILRGGMSRQPIEVDLTWYIENGNIESLPIIRPGDTIYIPKKANVIRELSDFMRDAIFIFGFFRVFN
jgi:polysaccharide export outer membrane protein